MALCRCKNHRPPEDYVDSVSPIGYPDTSSICGRPSCLEPGLIWLKNDERIKYQQGKRLFSFATNVTKVKVV